MTPATRAACIDCGQASVLAELGRCHDVAGFYYCDPDAGYAAQTIPTVAAPSTTGKEQPVTVVVEVIVGALAAGRWSPGGQSGRSSRSRIGPRRGHPWYGWRAASRR